jgi:hypothetical protein
MKVHPFLNKKNGQPISGQDMRFRFEKINKIEAPKII